MTEKILRLDKEQVIFWGLVSVLFLCAGFYMYCINATVHNVVTRQNLEAEAAELALELGSEEFSYITKRNSITLDLAHTLGFKDVSEKQYVIRGEGTRFAFLQR